MLQAAVTGCFDFTKVTPYYDLRLKLVLQELRRMNVMRMAENAGLHCAVLASTATGEGRSKNFDHLNHNMKILSLYLRQSDPNANSEDDDPVLREWKRRNEDGGQQQEPTRDES